MATGRTFGRKEFLEWAFDRGDFPPGVTVDHMYEAFQTLQAELLSGDSKWRCNDCGSSDDYRRLAG